VNRLSHSHNASLAIVSETQKSEKFWIQLWLIPNYPQHLID